MIKVKDWLLANDVYDESILVDVTGSVIDFFFDTTCYDANVLQVEKVNDFTCRLITDYKRSF